MLLPYPVATTARSSSAAEAELNSRSAYSIALAMLVFLWLATLATHRSLPMTLEALCILGFPVAAVWFLRQSTCGAKLLRVGLLPLPPEKRSPPPGWRWFMLGLLTILLGATILELGQPLYFTQDDSLANGVVGMVIGGRSLFGGQFPVWNPCQYMGSPMASMSYWSLTYPPTYLSYAVAKYVLGNEWWTMEVYQLGHLLLSYPALYWAAREVGLRPMTASLAAVTVTLSGSSLIMGRSWYATIPLNLWLPLLVVGVCRLRRGPVSWRWVFANGLVMGLLFHVGYPQTWVYAMLFFLGCCGLLWWLGEIPLRRALYAVPAQLVAVAVASPLLLVLLLETRGCENPPYGHGIGLPAVAAMLLPYPLVRAPHPEGWGSSDLAMMGQMYYGGTLLTFLAFAGMASFLALRHTKRTVSANYWLLVAAVWFGVSLGHKGVLWAAMQQLPGFSKFSCPFKVQQFFHCFAALGAGVVLDRLLSGTRRRVRWELVLAAAVGGLMLYHCWMAKPSFYSYGYRPYPELPAPFERLRQSPQRVAAIAPRRSGDPTFPWSLQLNSPTAYGMRAVLGYDPLVAYNELMRPVLATFADHEQGWEIYGVRWVVVHRTATDPMLCGNEVLRRNEALSPEDLNETFSRLKRKGAKVYYASAAVTIYELPHTQPMAFATEEPDRALPLRTDHGGIFVDTSSLAMGRSICVNYLMRPFMSALADGIPVAVVSDRYGRMQLAVPPQTREIAIRYRPPWHWGFAAGAVLVVLAGVAVMCLRVEG